MVRGEQWMAIPARNAVILTWLSLCDGTFEREMIEAHLGTSLCDLGQMTFGTFHTDGQPGDG